MWWWWRKQGTSGFQEDAARVRVQVRPIADGHQGSEPPGCHFPQWVSCGVLHETVDSSYLFNPQSPAEVAPTPLHRGGNHLQRSRLWSAADLKLTCHLACPGLACCLAASTPQPSYGVGSTGVWSLAWLLRGAVPGWLRVTSA